MYIEQALLEVAASIRYAADTIAAALKPQQQDGPAQPGPFLGIRFLSERKVDGMPDLRTYEVDFPAVPATSPDGDANVKQHFSYTVDGEAQPEQTFDLSTTMATVEVPQGAEIEFKMEHEDDDGKRGPAKTQIFTAVDEVGPDAPGDFGAIRFIGERTVPD